MQTFVYDGSSTTGLPSLTLPWVYESSAGVWTNLDLTAYSFVLTLVDADGTTQLTKTDLTGQDGSVLITWTAGDLDLAAGLYTMNVAATSGGLTRHYSPQNPIRIRIV